MTLAVDVESIKRLTNLADINRALHETHARERSIEAELEELLSKRSAIEETFVTLHDSASEVRGQMCSSGMSGNASAAHPRLQDAATFLDHLAPLIPGHTWQRTTRRLHVLWILSGVHRQL